jgi:hypothetical protein
MKLRATFVWWALGALCLTAGAATGCELVAGLDFGATPPAGTGGGGSGGSAGGAGSGGAAGSAGAGGATGGSGGQGGEVCSLASYPSPPVGAMPGGTTELVVGVRSIDVGDEGGAPVGFDLDGKCTCPDVSSCLCPDPASCLAPLSQKSVCDAAGGIDSQAAKLFTQLSFVTNGSVGTTELSLQAESGEWSMVARVRDYNGTPDDGQVRFSLYPVVSFVSTNPGMPLWDGQDEWTLASTGVGPGGFDEPLYFDDNAYVSGGTLVASLPTSAIELATGDSRVPLLITAGFVVAKLVNEGGKWSLRDGVLTGRWKTTDIFSMMSAFRLAGGLPICTDDMLYGVVKDKICNLRDIFSGVGTPTTACDSLSLALGFDADPVKVSPMVAEPPMVPPGCSPQTDPANDSCN